jgi:hypothetical protein
VLLEDDDVSEIFPGPFDLCPILVTSLFDVESLEVLLEDDEILGDGERLEYVSEIFLGSFDVFSILSFSLFDVESLDELLEDDEVLEDDERPDFVCEISERLNLLPVLPSLFPDGEL